MKVLLAAAAASLAATVMACPASGVPGFAEILRGAEDIGRNCVVKKEKSPKEILYYCTQAIRSTAWHDTAWPYFARAIAYIQLLQLKSALADLNVAAKLASESDPNLRGIYFDRCYVRARLGNELPAALDDCNKALTLSPSDLHTLDLRALVEYRMAEFSASMADCDIVLKYRANSPPTLYLRGLAKLKTGDPGAGKEDIATATRHDPSVASYLASFGVTD